MIRRLIPRRSSAAVAIALAATAAALFPSGASAHALIGKQDLPLPEWLFIYGSIVILVISFVGLLLGWRRPHLEDPSTRPLERASKVLLGAPAQALAGTIGVALLVLVAWTGLTGTVAPDRNFSLTFVFATFWIGFALLSVVAGNVFAAFNPWRAVGRVSSAAFSRLVGQSAPAPLRYPERLGRWPAAGGLIAFLLLELVWGQSGFPAGGITPREVAVASLVYSIYTWVAMSLYGVDRWLERGETFSVYFGMFASLAPLTVEEGRIVARRPLAGSTRWAGPAGSLAIVLVAIGGTTFDGAQEGLLQDQIASLVGSLQDAGLGTLAALRAANAVYLLLTLAAVAAIYWAAIWGMRSVERKLTTRELGRVFTHAFIPIALAYLLAHYFSYTFFLEQAQFTFLLSDPFGTGADVFGTASSGIDYTAISANTIWYVQFGAVVVGHATALALGHDRALKIWGNSRDAAWSQMWMLVLMMFFSMLALLLLSQANG